MPVDTADYHLNNADTYYHAQNSAAVEQEIIEAVRILSADGAEIIASLSSAEFETPLFTIVRRITTVLVPDTTNTEFLFSDTPLPKTDSPKDVITALQTIYTKDEPDATEQDTSRIEMLIALLTGQQTLRETIFADSGVYQTAADAAAPYLIGFLSYTGDEFETAEEKADSMLYGPVKRLAELFYSLLTSSLTAGLLLLLIRRLIPIGRPSKASSIINAAVLTASNMPVIIEGLRAVSHELGELRRVVKGTQ